MPVKIKIKDTKKEKEKMSTIEVGRILPTTEKITKSVDVFHEYYNAGEKEIKYITFSYLPYNSVNDVVACTASEKTEVSGRLTGPIPPKHKSYVKWENLWFNPTVATVVLTKIHVQFMDNSEELIDGKDVVYMHDQKSVYYNEVTIPAQKKEEERKKIEAERKRIEDASKELSKSGSKAEAISTCSSIFSKFKDEETLLKVLDGARPCCAMGYCLGDYIEKEYSTNEELMKKAVSYWKHSIEFQQKYYNTPAAKEHAGYPEKYAAKIKKYEPAYVIPKKAGCVSFG